jgi:SAM-dependent methyltransferase
MDIIKMLSIKHNDDQKWVKYYELETYKYYNFILNVLPNNQNILEIGSGGGVFYDKNRDILKTRNNKYTCIDIDEPSIEYSKTKCNYVKFYVKDVCDFSKMEFRQYDILLLVQSYIQLPSADNSFKEYFEANPSGCIMMINTIFPTVLSGIARFCKTRLLPYLLNNNCVSGKALTLRNIDTLGKYLDRTVTNIYICNSLSGFAEYLTIIR